MHFLYYSKKCPTSCSSPSSPSLNTYFTPFTAQVLSWPCGESCSEMKRKWWSAEPGGGPWVEGSASSGWMCGRCNHHCSCTTVRLASAIPKASEEQAPQQKVLWVTIPLRKRGGTHCFISSNCIGHIPGAMDKKREYLPQGGTLNAKQSFEV